MFITHYLHKSGKPVYFLMFEYAENKLPWNKWLVTCCDAHDIFGVYIVVGSRC